MVARSPADDDRFLGTLGWLCYAGALSVIAQLAGIAYVWRRNDASLDYPQYAFVFVFWHGPIALVSCLASAVVVSIIGSWLGWQRSTTILIGVVTLVVVSIVLVALEALRIATT
jgi:hypothetical protein